MSAVDQGTLTQSSPRRSPYAVRLSPQVVNRLSNDLQKLRSSRPKSHREITGLLFGTAEEGLVNVKASKALPAGISEKLSVPEQSHAAAALQILTATLETDAETSSLQLIGWYSIRLGKSPGLLDSDVDFHNLHFRNTTDLALLLRPEQKADLVMELYGRTPEQVFTSTEHCGSSLRLSTDSPVDKQIELAMRSRLDDDLRTEKRKVGPFLEQAEGNGEGERRIEFSKTRSQSTAGRVGGCTNNCYGTRTAGDFRNRSYALQKS